MPLSGAGMTFRSMPAPLHVNLQHLKPLANLSGMGMTLRSMPGSLYANLAHEEHATQPGGVYADCPGVRAYRG